jgi:hypothetical protein
MDYIFPKLIKKGRFGELYIYCNGRSNTEGFGKIGSTCER